MKTTVRVIAGAAQHIEGVPPHSVDLVVTSPPYPMIEMWDGVFGEQDSRILERLAAGRGLEAFEIMHSLLDSVWRECDRVLKPGGMICINIGDATRTVDSNFQLYSNHSQVLRTFFRHGYTALPDILWRKQTNAPNKFLGSGMLPVGAYVTYEHEYILILRKGPRRRFTDSQEKALRRRSAFFWEERNVWFSDIWHDIKGTRQALVDSVTRRRSAAFPLEIAYRLISMFSIQGDVILDPFVGTGTTLRAALACGRSAIGVDIDPSLTPVAMETLISMRRSANTYSRDRLSRHIEFAKRRAVDSGPMKYCNVNYGFPVMTRQETDILLPDVISIARSNAEVVSVEYADSPQLDFDSASMHEMPAYRGSIQTMGQRSELSSSGTGTDSQDDLQLYRS